MIDVGGGYLDIPAVETAGFKMIDVSRALLKVVNWKMKLAIKFIKKISFLSQNTEGS